MEAFLLLVVSTLLVIWFIKNQNLKAKLHAVSNDFERERQRLESHLNDANARIEQLKRYEAIIDAEAYANEVILTAEQDAQSAILKAKEDVIKLMSDAVQGIQTAKAEAKALRADGRIAKESAQRQAEAIIQKAGVEYRASMQKAERVVEEAEQIIQEAHQKALAIGGDANKALQNAGEWERTAKAMKNIIEGYGDRYLKPTYSLLDDLAEELGHTEAGENLKEARNKTRLLVESGMAAKCDYVEAQRRETAIQFVLDAFNGKVDSALSKVKKDNYGTLEQMIQDAFQVVNSNGKAFRNAVITEAYLRARMQELHWAVITQELKWQEAEEQRRIKEQIREEEKARRDFERAIKESQKEEDTLKRLIEKAQRQVVEASEAQKADYELKLEALEGRLKEAEEKNQRALSMAQQTKSGNVYVISNIGSFGEDVYKIGMTRRLEPLDRIKELGDASVPFEFDVHSMIYCDDAPGLERELHKRFLRMQMNKVNPRKEFFKVGILDIKEEVERMGINAHWTLTSDARQYKESLAIEEAIASDAVKAKAWEEAQVKEEEKIAVESFEEIELS